MEQLHRFRHLPRRVPNYRTRYRSQSGQSDQFEVADAVEQFLVSRHSQDFCDRTVETYANALKKIQQYLDRKGITNILEFDRRVADLFMSYLNKIMKP